MLAISLMVFPRINKVCRILALANLILVSTYLPSVAGAQGTLANGAREEGTISAANTADSWTFAANAGDGIFLRVGATNFTPTIQLYDPSNALVVQTNSGNGFTRDGFVSAQATKSGTYTVLVSASYAGQSGGYALYLAQAPGTFVVSAGDEGGALINGSLNPGTISLGDLDLWNFTANAGDSLMLRVGATNFTPWIRLYGPNGALVGETNSGNGFTRDGFLTLQATNAGAYTVVVSASYAGQSGDYALSLAQAPATFVVSAGDEGGALTNGTLNPGTISLGDLDLWSFKANAGDSLVLRVGATNFTPWIRLYGPNGVLVGETNSGNGFTRDGFITLEAANTGDYTVVISAAYAGQSGDYALSLAQAPGIFVVSPGDEGGALTNGTLNPGTISLGDLDLWSFTATGGQSIFLRVGATNFTPWIRLYGPTGALVGETNSGNGFTRDGFLALQATTAGDYTVVVSASYAGQSGDYALGLALVPSPIVVSPGQSGGALTNGFANIGNLGLGELAVWSFLGTAGDSNVLRVVSTNFTPWIRLYGPTGALVGETNSGNGFTRQGQLTFVVTDGGLYTVVLSASYAGQSGGFSFKQSRVPPDLVVPAAQTIDELTPLQVTISAQDPDVPIKPLVFTLLSAPPGVTLATSSATNATLSWATTEADGPSTNVITASVTDEVNGRAFIRTNSFTVVVNEINTPPQLTVPSNQTIDELTPLSVSATATDSDIPANQLTFSLDSSPAGMAIDPKTGAIVWTPTEAQGPSTNLIRVVVTDSSPSAVNAQHLSATNSFTVVVREVNTPPQLTVPGNQIIDELTPMNVAATATDSDLPANTLTFSLVAPPSGMTINPGTGAINWTPSEAQGPSTNTITVMVADNGVPVLSATKTFTVVVNEVNSAPVLPAQTDRVIDELTLLTVTNTATDSDIPANTLTYKLQVAPTNATMSANGIITWSPTEAQGPSTNIFTTVVTDNGTPSLSATNTFTVVVNEVNSAPILPVQTNQVIDPLTLLTVVNTATDSDIPANTLTYKLQVAPTNATISANGIITWTPTQAQGPSTNIFTTVVTDNGTPNLSATNSFAVMVNKGAGVPVVHGPVLEIQRVAGGLMQLTITGDTGHDYELQQSANLANWDKLVQFLLSASPYLYIDPESATNATRFYRLQLVQ
jgi:hypothetical protein